LQSKQNLIELKQRILCNTPTEAMSGLFHTVPTGSIDNSMDTRTRQRLLDQHEKQVQQKITNHMALLIAEAEEEIHRRRQAFNEETLRTRINDAKGNGPLTKDLIDLVYRRFDIIKKRIELIGAFRWNQFIRHENPIRFSPSMIIDTSSHCLTDEQRRLLDRGPTYVPPWQLYASLTGEHSVHDRIHQLYVPLKHRLSILTAKHSVNAAQSMFMNKKIKDVFTDVFSIPLPNAMQQRACREQNIVQAIQEQLKAHDLILRRTADQRNVFYLGNRKDFENEANAYLTTTDRFEIMDVVDEVNLSPTYDSINKMINFINKTIESIFNNKKLHGDQLKRLLVNATKVEVPYLYFLPNLSEVTSSI
jgi:hypothetical protein